METIPWNEQIERINNTDSSWEKTLDNVVTNSSEKDPYRLIGNREKNLDNTLKIEENMWNLFFENPEIKDAIEFIKKAHEWQFRKINNEPYSEHPIWVAKTLLRFNTDTKIIIACLLHDVIEDVENWEQLLLESFDAEIVDLVREVSESDKSLSWEERKKAYLDHLNSVSIWWLFISLADRLWNLRSQIGEYQQFWEELWEKFNSWKEKQLWFLREYYKSVEKVIIDLEKNQANKNDIDSLKKLLKEFRKELEYFLHLIKLTEFKESWAEDWNFWLFVEEYNKHASERWWYYYEQNNRTKFLEEKYMYSWCKTISGFALSIFRLDQRL